MGVVPWGCPFGSGARPISQSRALPDWAGTNLGL